MQEYADIYFTAKSLHMFRVSQHLSSGLLKTVTAASGTGHNIGTATSLRRGLIGTHVGGKYLTRYYDLYRRLRLQFLVFLMMGAVDTRNMWSDFAVI